MQETAKVMALLEEAKAGVSAAQDFICRHVWEKYGYKINGYFSSDSAEDRDDLQQIFWLAVAEAIPKLDNRGNPVWHLAVRGTWKVGAHIRRRDKIAKARQLVSLDAPAKGAEEETWTTGSRLRDEKQDVESFVVQQLGSLQQVELIGELGFSPTAQRALEVILSGEAGDPTEIGFNKNLAAVLGVSPQRASQAMTAIRSTVEDAGVER